MNGMPGLAMKGLRPKRHAQPYHSTNADVRLQNPTIKKIETRHKNARKALAKIGAVNQNSTFGKTPYVGRISGLGIFPDPLQISAAYGIKSKK
jgi:hypothetical protein